MKKKVTVVIPNYNKANFVSETLQSIACQTLEDWQVIFVDDQSTDKSLEIASSYSERDDRIVVLSNPGPRNGNVCRNIGLSEAAGEYIVFLDSDDLLSRTALADRVSVIDTLEIDFAVFPMGTFHESIGDFHRLWIPRKRNALKRFLRHDLPWAIMAPIYRTEFVRNQNGYSTNFERLQDVEFHTRCLLAGARFETFSQSPPDCFYRISQRRTSLNYEEQVTNQVNGALRFASKFFHHLEYKRPDLIKALLGTLLRTAERVCLHNRSHEVDKKFTNMMLDRIFSHAVFESASFLRRGLFRYYVQILAKRKPLKGFGWAVRKLTG